MAPLPPGPPSATVGRSVDRTHLDHGVGPELLLIADLVLLGGLGVAPQPPDHLLLVLHVHGYVKLELGQLFAISSDNVLPGESKVKNFINT